MRTGENDEPEQYDDATIHLHISDGLAWDVRKGKNGKGVLVPPGTPPDDAILKWSGYDNCRNNRRRACKICQDCPFRPLIEAVEARQ